MARLPLWKRILATIAVVLAGPATAQAERRVALVVGNDAYAHAPALTKAAADAAALTEQLRRQGFEVFGGANLDAAASSEALGRFEGAVGSGDLALAILVGQGLERGTRAWLSPVDAPWDVAGDGAATMAASVEAGELLRRLRGKGARAAILVLAVPRTDPFKAPPAEAATAPAPLVEDTFVLYATGPGEAPRERLAESDPDPHSVFVRVLLRELANPGVPLRTLADEVRDKVRELTWTASRLPPLNAPVQQPDYKDATTAPIVLVPAAPTPAAPAAPR